VPVRRSYSLAEKKQSSTSSEGGPRSIRYLGFMRISFSSAKAVLQSVKSTLNLLVV
jgi:hypothetical protein